MRHRAIMLMLALAGLAMPAAAFADGSPLQFLRRLMRPPATAVMSTFRRERPARHRGAPTIPADAIPLPRPRPEEAVDAAVIAAPVVATDSAGATSTAGAGPAADPVPLPRPRPLHVVGPPVRLAMMAPPAVVVPHAAAPQRLASCRAALAALGVEALPLAPIDEDRCQVPDPVAVSALAGGATQLTTKAILNCAMAETLAGWLKRGVTPAAARLGGRVTGLRIAASYACRNRDNLPNAKLSEHGLANAVDISAFEIDHKRWIAVGGAHDPAEARFLAAIRKAACGPFTTVLGPGTDKFHTDHFHFDLARRRYKSHSLYCH